MLTITIPKSREWDETKEEFIQIPETTFSMEHSLISLSKWEQKWHKPFMDHQNNKTTEEIIDYFRCMTVTPAINPDIYNHMPIEVINKIMEYIEDPMTATWFSEEEVKKSGIGRREIITSEIIYYWMVTLNIPAQFEKWHLNRLITLIRVVNIKNSPPKKLNKKETLARNRKLNSLRKAKYKTKG